MSLERMLKENLIKRQKPDFKQIEKQLNRSEKDIETAKKNLKFDTTWAITIAYHSMIRAARALMFSNGFLPTTKNTHKTIVDFTNLVLGSEPEYNNLINKFNRLRKQRHNFIYESENGFTEEEAESTLKTAKSLLKKIKDLIKTENPQIELFKYKEWRRNVKMWNVECEMWERHLQFTVYDLRFSI